MKMLTCCIASFILAGMASCKSNESKESASADSTKSEIDFVKPQNTDSVEKLAELYNSREVYFEIVMRTNATTNDTSIPQVIMLNYPKSEISVIREKTKPLQKLTNEDLIALYQRTFSDGRKVIYGVDDREEVIYDTIDINQVKDLDNPYMNDGKCVVALIPQNRLTLNARGNYVLQPSGKFKDEYTLCETERFLNEPVAAECTGFAVAADKIVTAGHCIDSSNFQKYYYVFDYMVDSSGVVNRIINKNCVYEAVEFIKGVLNEKTKEDFAIIKINKPIVNARIAQLNTNMNSIKPSSLFHVIGTPCGLPMKIAYNATLRENSNPHFFVITSDTYGGNSGSPVFNSNSHLVEGILVRGEKDFKLKNQFNGIALPTKNCNISVVCPFNGCRGEDVSRVKQFINYVNK